MDTIPLVPGQRAVVAVPVATIWTAPVAGRPAVEPLALAASADGPSWPLAMPDAASREWLFGRVQTQALMGSAVLVTELLRTAGDEGLAEPSADAADADGDALPLWARVVVLDQACGKDPRGYPGWMPAAQLALDDRFSGPDADAPQAVVTADTAALLREDGTEVAISFLTMLPLAADSPAAEAPAAAASADGGADDGADDVADPGAATVRVAVPGGGWGTLRRSDVRVGTGPGATDTPSTEGAIAVAHRFLGLRYLWGGMSAWGYDCSGLVGAACRSQGLVLPRDAGDQRDLSGLPRVEREDLQPGDLVFFYDGPGGPDIRHVGMRLADGQMIHAPNSAGAIEIVDMDAYDVKGEYAGAVRPLG